MTEQRKSLIKLIAAVVIILSAAGAVFPVYRR